MTTPLPPSGYPWREPLVVGVLGPEGLTDAAGSPDLAGRVPVLAVGSNAGLGVLTRKLDGLLSTGLPLAPVRVRGLGVGHSAHVSAGGYVAAAPMLDAGADRTLLLCWLDAGQLAAMDATEPHYRRVRLPAAVGLTADDGTQVTPAGTRLPAEVYASVLGVLGDRHGILPLGTQAEVLVWLAERLPEPHRRALRSPGAHDHLADPLVREHIRHALARAGLVRGSGLTPRRMPHGRLATRR